MKRKIMTLLVAAALCLGPIRLALAYGWGDLAADIVTGGAYSATRAGVSATQAAVDGAKNFIDDAKELKKDIEELLASIGQLGQHIATEVRSASGIAKQIAEKQIEGVRSLPARTAGVIQRNKAALDADIKQVRALAEQLAVAPPADAKRIRDQMRALGATIAGRASREEHRSALAAMFHPPVPQFVPCNPTQAFSDPKKLVQQLDAASARMANLAGSINAAVTQPITASVNLAGSQTTTALNVGYNSTVGSLQSAKSSLDFGVNELRIGAQTLATIIADPASLLEHPLSPIQSALDASQRVLDQFDAQIDQAATRFRQDVLATTRNALNQSEQFQFTLLEYDRLALDVRKAAIPAMACGDPGSLSVLAAAVQAAPRPRQQIPAWKPEGVQVAVQIRPVHAPGLRPLGQARGVFARFAAKQAEKQKAFDDIFRGKGPAEAAQMRAAIAARLRQKFPGNPQFVAAAEKRLDDAIAGAGRRGIIVNAGGGTAAQPQRVPAAQPAVIQRPGQPAGTAPRPSAQ